MMAANATQPWHAYAQSTWMLFAVLIVTVACWLAAQARLAKHPSNLQRIRELDGMEVLYMLGNRTRHEGKA